MSTLDLFCFRLFCDNYTYMKIARSLIKSSTADRLPNTWFITMKKKAPILKKTVVHEKHFVVV